MPQTDDYGRHEVLHVAALIRDLIDKELLEHDQIKNNEVWKGLTEATLTNLHTLYNAIGDEHLEE